MLPPLVKLGTSATPGESKYVCLAGAGLSKDAGLPTAWDLMLETAALLRVADEDDGTDLQTWFLNSRYKDFRYSELIGEFFTSSVEQQSFIREKLRANEPGKAHLLLAELARLKVLRCIITTNFDDLIEQALGKVGLSVQVISNDEDLEHSEPLIHCKQFRVLKAARDHWRWPVTKHSGGPEETVTPHGTGTCPSPQRPRAHSAWLLWDG